MIGAVFADSGEDAMGGPAGVDVGDGGDVCCDNDEVVGVGPNPVVQCSSAPAGLGGSGYGASVEVFDVNEGEAAGGHVVFLMCLVGELEKIMTYEHIGCQADLLTQGKLMATVQVKSFRGH